VKSRCGCLSCAPCPHAQEDRAAAQQKAEQVVAKLKEMGLADAAELLRQGIEETLFYEAFPLMREVLGFYEDCVSI
jgi:hypothetical protein